MENEMIYILHKINATQIRVYIMGRTFLFREVHTIA
ncbi:hypothetical protein MPF_1398 [Methanohalophilus portucalensis FDF-1]|uniref:Uncharacterized protein n=1 Tax=Methanohalophilus portucalensis FDF-1 TaxID=523843 RepID=A0A1L9C3B8_9EURY|nr:hypothetical protein MPF_1398 [Methanohalophilus portucalensis FDF-1]